MKLEIDVDDPRAEDVRELLATHLEFSRETTPAEFSFALDVDALVDPSVTFFSARGDGRLVGIAALRRLSEDHAEVKSMHTSAAMRRQGVGRALVVHVVSFARAHGYRRLSLETGATDDFEAARGLYASLGFTPCDAFGDYVPSAYNDFMTMSLEPASDRRS